MKLSSHQKGNLLALLALAWGWTAMIGHMLQIPALKGLGLASAAAPYTKVFCQAEDQSDGRKFETFAMEFRVHFKMENGTEQSMKITPEIYQKMKGPYQRRNVYGAVLAYGPALPDSMRGKTLHYALVAPGSVPEELGIPANATDFRIELISRTKGSKNQWSFTP